MSNVYTKKKLKEIELKRDVQILEPLLWNIAEEGDIFKSVRYSIKDHNSKSSIIVFSDKQVYKTYSILYLIKDFDRTVRYYILDFAMLLDSWWNNSTVIKKEELLDYDVLIIHGSSSIVQAEYKATALKELISTRKTLRKFTWLFIEGIDKEYFDKKYEGVVPMFDLKISSKF